MKEEVRAAFERALQRELKSDEHVTELEENAGGVWFTTNKGRTLSFMIFECEAKQ